ncbi:MAG: RluA family pseudouridine synthase [Gammaproteobacteria bacterium]|nr:RluA family pseudouridine synthase [Gammaproteobacteria bacterium]
MSDTRSLQLDLVCDGANRLDRILAGQLRLLHPDLPLSRRWLKPLFRSGRIRFKGRAATASMILAADHHRVEIQDWDMEELRREFTARSAPGGAFIPVVYEDEFLLALDKPAGTPSTPHSGRETDTAVNSALAHYPALVQVGNSPLEPGLVHRLDTDTRGLLLFAKRADEFERLKGLWKAGGVAKIYRAWVMQAPLEDRIDFPVGHDSRSGKKMIAIRTEEDWRRIRGNPLECLTEILETSQEAGGRVRLIMRLHGGAMHQIRCHLAAIGCPIIGDSLYGGAPAPRLELQAWKLIIPLGDRAPSDCKDVTIESQFDP